MNKIHLSMAVLVLALVGLAGCDDEPQAVGDANPARVAEMKQALRDLWVGHIFWVRHVVSNIKGEDREHGLQEAIQPTVRGLTQFTEEYQVI